MSYFEQIGYKIPKRKDKHGILRTSMGTTIKVKVSDLKEHSPIKLTKICDSCGKHTPNQPYQIIIKQRNIGDGKDMCSKCRREEIHNRSISNGNFLFNTHPHIANLLNDEKVGYEVSYNSAKEEYFRCPICNYNYKKIIYNVVKHGFSCPNCSVGISFPEKVIANILNQLNIEYRKDNVFKWSKDIVCKNKKLNGSKKYDFYIPELSLIIETHGNQHYDGSFQKLNGRTLEDEKENDRLKEKLAKENGIENYIVIDCRKSELEWIKNNIFKSNLPCLLNINKVNWTECQNSTFTTLVKDVCEAWENGIRPSRKISKIFNISITTVVKYLKRGSNLGWCNYDPIHEKNNNNKKRKKVVQLTMDDKFIHEYESGKKASKETGISTSGISMVCSGKRDSVQGFKWMYKEDYDRYLKENNLIHNSFEKVTS